MTFRITAATAATLALAFAAPAAAKVYPLYLQGTIASGYDQAGYFLSGGGDLTGRAFKAAFFTDDSVGGREEDDGQRTWIFGADERNPTTATLTINGVTVAFGEPMGPIGEDHSDEYYGETRQQVGASDSYRRMSEGWIYDDRDWSWVYFHQEAGGFGQDFLADHDWRSLTTAQAQAATRIGSFTIQHYDNHSGYTPLATGRFEITSAAIPEPGAWTLMIAGLGLAGGLLRRRRGVLAEA